jgi:hypothetical protein
MLGKNSDILEGSNVPQKKFAFLFNCLSDDIQKVNFKKFNSFL